jgi:hypothetical protein
MPEEIVMHRITLYVAIAFITFIIGISAESAWNLKPTAEAAMVKEGVYSRPVAASSRLKAEEKIAREELVEIMRQYDIAQSKHDAAFFKRLEADSFTLTAYGRTYTLAEDLALMQSLGNSTIYTSDDLDVQPYGDAAVVTGRMTATHLRAGDEYSWRWIHMFIKRNGQWQILSTTQVSL